MAVRFACQNVSQSRPYFVSLLAVTAWNFIRMYFSRVLDAKNLLNPEECPGLFLLTNFFLVPFRVLILKGTSFDNESDF